MNECNSMYIVLLSNDLKTLKQTLSPPTGSAFFRGLGEKPLKNVL
jgi:hypothetical protein